jgi:hypothetical protein
MQYNNFNKPYYSRALKPVAPGRKRKRKLFKAHRGTLRALFENMGRLRVGYVANYFGISYQVAMDWLSRFVSEGLAELAVEHPRSYDWLGEGE